MSDMTHSQRRAAQREWRKEMMAHPNTKKPKAPLNNAKGTLPLSRLAQSRSAKAVGYTGLALVPLAAAASTQRVKKSDDTKERRARNAAAGGAAAYGGYLAAGNAVSYPARKATEKKIRETPKHKKAWSRARYKAGVRPGGVGTTQNLTNAYKAMPESIPGAQVHRLLAVTHGAGRFGNPKVGIPLAVSGAATGAALTRKKVSKAMKPMSDTELSRRKKRQALYSKTTSTAGLTALGLKGAQVAAKANPRTARFSKPLSEGATTSAIIGSGVGGFGGYNFARYTAEDARRDRLRNKKVSKAMGETSAFGVVHKREAEMNFRFKKLPEKERRRKRAKAAAFGAATGGVGSAALTSAMNAGKGGKAGQAALVAGGVGAGAGALLGAAAKQPKYKLELDKVKKAYDPEERRHRNTGVAIGAAGAGAGLAGYAATKQGQKAKGALAASRGQEVESIRALGRIKPSLRGAAASKNIASSKKQARDARAAASKFRLSAIKSGGKAAALGAGAAGLGATAVALDGRAKKRSRTYRAWYDG